MDTLVAVAQDALKNVKKTVHPSLTLGFIGKYLSLFALSEEKTEAFSSEVLNLLTTIFRQKMFPKQIQSNRDVSSIFSSKD